MSEVVGGAGAQDERFADVALEDHLFVELSNPRAAWTGPLSRGDYATISKHVKALRRFPREFQDAYAALALLSARVLSKRPAATSKKLVGTLKTRGKNSL